MTASFDSKLSASIGQHFVIALLAAVLSAALASLWWNKVIARVSAARFKTLHSPVLVGLHKLSLITFTWPQLPFLWQRHYLPPLSLTSLLSQSLVPALVVAFSGLHGGFEMKIDDDSGYPRFGFMALGCFAILLLLPLKNSLLDVMLGFSFHQAMIWHRAIGYMLCVLVAVHGGLYLRLWFAADFVTAIMQTMTMVWYGVGFAIVLAVLLSTSLPPVRRHLYPLFKTVHLLSLPCLIILVNLHTPKAIPYTAIPLCFYLVDYAIRIGKSGRYVKVIQAETIGDTTRLTICSPPFCRGGFLPGHHLYLNVPEVELLGWHPISFTSSFSSSTSTSSKWLTSIASDSVSPPSPLTPTPTNSLSSASTPANSFSSSTFPPTNSKSLEIIVDPKPPSSDVASTFAAAIRDQEKVAGQIVLPKHHDCTSSCGATLLIRGVGRFSKALHQSVASRTALAAIGIPHEPLRVRIEGPYGRPMSTFTSSPCILGVAGGIGVTPVLAALLAAVRNNNRCCFDTHYSHLPMPRAMLVWAIQKPDAWRCAEKEILELLRLGCEVTIHVTSSGGNTEQVVCDLRTRIVAAAMADSTATEKSRNSQDNYDHDVAAVMKATYTRLSVCFGRPDLNAVFTLAKERVKGTGVLPVSVCGSSSLVVATRTAARNASCRECLCVVHSESFEI